MMGDILVNFDLVCQSNTLGPLIMCRLSCLKIKKKLKLDIWRFLKIFLNFKNLGFKQSSSISHCLECLAEKYREAIAY